MENENEQSQQSSEDQIVQYLKYKKSQNNLTSTSPVKREQRENKNPTPSTKQPRFIVKDKPQSQNDITVEIDKQEVYEEYEDAKKLKLAQLKQEILNENDLIETKQNEQMINNYVHNSLSSKDQVLNETFPVDTKTMTTKQNSLDSQPHPKELQQSPQIKGNRKFPKYSPIPASTQQNWRKEDKNKQMFNSRKSPRAMPARSPRMGTQGGNQDKRFNLGNAANKRECRSPRQSNQEKKNEGQVSDKSRQIYFRKLQKEVEQAIRESDVEGKGGLTIDEMKQCFFNLDYFPSMQQKISNSNKANKTFDFTYQNTLRNQLIQEKVFLFNLWQMLNPLNQQTIDNAMIYDILLLLIYNVQSPSSICSSFLGEYLVNMYKEQKIDIESFSAYTSNHPETEDDTMDNENISNVNKYLEFNNIWTIDKLAQEFKGIHGHKVAYVQNSNKRSRSPSPNFGASQMSRSPRNFDPNDTRRYKKDVIEQVTSMTFKPQLSSKTKDIDQVLTQKLLQDSQTVQSKMMQGSGPRRDNSADALLKSKQALTDDSNSVNQQLTSMQRYELLFFRQHLADQRIERAKENMQNKELTECSFQPQLVSNYKSQNQFKTYSNPSHQANTLIKELNDKIEKSRRKYEIIEIEKHEKEMSECTFKPQINSLMNQKKANQQPNQVPKGYYEQINRMRKIAEEKKQREDKEHKRLIGEKYDKVKLMNSKPPSFLDQDAKKRKKKLLMYVDVNITPTKTGRIGIYEGDDIKETARNFAKTFQLNHQMYQMLIKQLDQHLQSYRERMGIQNNFSGKAPYSLLSDNNQDIDEQDEEYEDTSNNHSPHSNKDIRSYMDQMVSEKSSREGWLTKSPGTKFQNQRNEYSYQ